MVSYPSIPVEVKSRVCGERGPYEGEVSQLVAIQEQGQLGAAQQTIRSRFADQQRTLEQQKMSAESRLRQQTSIIENKFQEQRRQIATDEQTARQQSPKGSAESRAQLRAALQSLAEDAEQTKKTHEASLEQLNGEIWEAAKRLPTLSRRQNQARRRYSAYMPLRFRKYVQRAMGWN